MHQPSRFKITQEREIFNFIKQSSFGQLISLVNNRLFSTHIPFLLSNDHKKLYAHIAKQNPQHHSIEQQEVMITLNGPHDYISPSWYESAGVPTWNYQTVHIYGHCKLLTAPQEIKKIIEDTTHYYEQHYKKPWKPNYDEKMLGAIVGLEITIKDIQCTFKLSQNKSQKNQKSVIKNLQQEGSNELANAMKKHLNL